MVAVDCKFNPLPRWNSNQEYPHGHVSRKLDTYLFTTGTFRAEIFIITFSNNKESFNCPKWSGRWGLLWWRSWTDYLISNFLFYVFLDFVTKIVNILWDFWYRWIGRNFIGVNVLWKRKRISCKFEEIAIVFFFFWKEISNLIVNSLE